MTWFKRLHQLSFRSRLMIAAILCILFPWVLTYFVSNYLTEDALEELAVNQSRQSLNLLGMSIQQILDDVMYTSNYVKFDSSFNQVMREHQLIEPAAPDASQEIALSLIEVASHLSPITNTVSPEYVTILFSNDLYYMNYPLSEFHPLDFKKEPWFEKLDTLSYYDLLWIGAHPTYIKSDQSENRFLISFGSYLRSVNSQNAYLIISIREQQISSLLENYQADDGSEYFLTDGEGTVYSSVDQGMITRTLPYDVNSNEQQIVERNGEKFFLVTRPVAYSDWRLVNFVPYNESIGNINRMNKLTITTQGVLLFIFLIGLIILVRELTKPLMELRSVTKSVEQGDLSQRAKMYGNNDITHLSSSFNEMLDTVEEMIDQVRVQEHAKRNAELEMLQAQINPHFLFNALNTIRMQTMLNGDKQSADLIQSLSSLLRMTVNRNNSFITLEEEIETNQHYIKLMNFRHQHTIKLELDLCDRASHISVPRFFLQPIVENAIIHGHSHGETTITIKAGINNLGQLILHISDNGRGMSEETMNSIKEKLTQKTADHQTSNHHSFNGIGIQNVYQRMKLIYGDHFTMDIRSTESVGTSYLFCIPIKKG
ncbi:sensor histidine kinase [Alkalihalobacillus sp. FSL R5-0424]